MSRQRAENWFLWTLPLIALRLLLPAGVMPGVDLAGPALALCRPDNIGRSTPDKPRAPEKGDSHGAGVCPFAAAAVMVPAGSVAVWVAPGVGLFIASTVPGTQRAARSGPLRTQYPRAPPLIS